MCPMIFIFIFFFNLFRISTGMLELFRFAMRRFLRLMSVELSNDDCEIFFVTFCRCVTNAMVTLIHASYERNYEYSISSREK